jgi:hypothetical protein
MCNSVSSLHFEFRCCVRVQDRSRRIAPSNFVVQNAFVKAASRSRAEFRQHHRRRTAGVSPFSSPDFAADEKTRRRFSKRVFDIISRGTGPLAAATAISPSRATASSTSPSRRRPSPRPPTLPTPATSAAPSASGWPAPQAAMQQQQRLRLRLRRPSVGTHVLTTCGCYQSCSRVLDDALEQVSKLTCLQSLSLGYCTRLTDAGLKQLTSLHRLRDLYIGYCSGISDSGLCHIGQLTRCPFVGLARVSVESSPRVTGHALEHVSKLTCATKRRITVRCFVVSFENSPSTNFGPSAISNTLEHRKSHLKSTPTCFAAASRAPVAPT